MGKGAYDLVAAVSDYQGQSQGAYAFDVVASGFMMQGTDAS